MNDASKPAVEQIPAATARALAEREDAVIIDVREPHEFEEEHIAGAQSIPVSSLNPEKLPRGKTAILYCGLGKRSAAAAEQLVQAGFDNVATVEGGIAGWKRSGLPTDGADSS